MKRRIFSLLVCLILLWAAPAVAAPQNVQAWINGELTATAGQGGEWYVIALSQSGSYDFTAYRAALLEYLAEARVSSATMREKYALTLAATGGEDAYIAEVMENSIGQQGVMSWVFGLHLLNNGFASTAHTAESVVEQLLALQLEDGGWAVTGSISDADVTAMTLQALAPHQDQPKAAAAVEQALTLLSSRQMEDGGYASYGVPNAESAAQVLTALSCLGIDAAQDARFIKNGCTLLDALAQYRLEDGAYSHTLGGDSNANATVQSFFALAAYQRLQEGKASIYLLDAPTPVWGWQTVASVIIAGLAVLLCLVFLVMRKRSWKNYAALLLGAALLILGVQSIEVQSAGSYYAPAATAKSAAIGTVTLSIRCDTVAGQAEHIPADGVILPETSFAIAQGDTVSTILAEASRAHAIPMDVSNGYVAGIQYLYEFDFGELSGWMYFVNDTKASVGSEQYLLQDGDVITWRYTCEIGSDLP